MSLAFEQIVMLIIFLIVLVVLIIFTQIPNLFGNQVKLQQELRGCCQAFIARGCPDTIPADIKCDGDNLNILAKNLGLDDNQTKAFCNCPLNKTFTTTIP